MKSAFALELSPFWELIFSLFQTYNISKPHLHLGFYIIDWIQKDCSDHTSQSPTYAMAQLF